MNNTMTGKEIESITDLYEGLYVYAIDIGSNFIDKKGWWIYTKGKWFYWDRIGFAIKELKKLTCEERINVFAKFCKHCGSDNLDCKCWNDE